MKFIFAGENGITTQPSIHPG